jgi:hypothetical protein
MCKDVGETARNHRSGTSAKRRDPSFTPKAASIQEASLRLHTPSTAESMLARGMAAFVCGVLLYLAPNCAGQGPVTSTSQIETLPSSAIEEKGLTFYEFYGGSFNSLGHVTELDTTVGYNFNRYFGVDAGIPVYFVGVSKTNTGPGPLPGNGIGDVYADLLFTLVSPAVNYLGTLRGTAPTGDTSKGFSTGRVTFNWDNYFDHDFRGLRPFADVAFADSIGDTHFFYRPFITFGYVAEFEGGLTYKIFSPLRVGASYYDDAPIGEQTVISREGLPEIKGPASIDRDNGYSAWLTIHPIPYITFEGGYDHSVRYRLDTFSFGIAFNVGSLYHKARGAL